MKSFSDYRQQKAGKLRKRTRRKSRGTVNIKSAKKILRDYLKKNNYNKKKTKKSIRKNIGSKLKRILKSKSKKKYKYTKRPSGH